MLFSERQKLEKEYYKWLNKNPNVKPCPFTVISFLDMNGNVVGKNEKDKIEVLKIAIELACVDLLNKTYPNKNFNNYKPKVTMERYERLAEDIWRKRNDNSRTKRLSN